VHERHDPEMILSLQIDHGIREGKTEVTAGGWIKTAGWHAIYDDEYLSIVTDCVSAVRGTSIYAQIQKVAARAFTIAKEHNRAKPGIEEIMEATQEVLPSAPAESPFPSPAAPPQAAKRVPRKKAIHEEIFSKTQT
jgi:hypothetical protein